MALTPDTPNEAFLREVDENLRRDQAADFAKTYGKWLVAAVVLFLAAVGGWLFWENRQQQQTAAQSEELMSIYNDIASGRTKQAQARLAPLKDSGNDIVSSLALLTEAAMALDRNDRNAALANYRAIADDKGMPESYRNLSLIRATALEFDTMKPEQVIARLEPLAKPGNPWFGTAGEMTAMAYLKQGQKEKAGRLFAAVAADPQVPETLRNRAVQVAATLGIEATAAPPSAAQPGSSE